jgi:hypothetical protein
VFEGVSAFESSSAQIRWRLCVRALITTTGWRRSYARARSVTGTAPVFAKAAGVSRPGTFTTIACPGLKPSERL